MSYPLPLTRTQAYLAYKAGVIQQSDLKPSLAVPLNGIDAWLAYWTEITNNYPKNPDGTPKILQEEEAYIAYLSGAVDEYPEKCLHRVGAYLRYLISARWGRPDHPLNREELYLSLIKTQFIPSGDPSSDIVIDGTAKAPFVDVRIYGDTLQQDNTAKALLNTKSETEETDEEIKSIIPEDKTVELEETEMPTVKAAVKSEAKIGASYDEIAKPMVEEDATAISYEKSTRAQSSPSPDNPQPIQTVTGEQTVSIIGKNLFDKDTPLSNKYIDASGNWITGQTIYIVQEYKAIPSSTYTFSFSSRVGSAYIRFAEYDSDGNFTKRTLVDTTNTTLTLRSDTHKMAWSIDARMDAGAYSTYFTDLQIEVGSTATAYEPFNPRDYKINLGKNLWGGDGIKQGTWNVEGTTSRVTLFLPCKVGDTYAFTNPDATAYKVDFGITTSPIQGSSTQKTETGWKQESTTIYTCGYDGFFFVQAAKANNSNFSVADAKAVAFQLEKGSTATPYAPYFTPIELCKLGDYQDYIWKDGDTWKVHKATSKTVITDENERGSFLSSTNTSRLAFGRITPQGTPQATNAELCDKLERKLNWNTDSQGFFMNGSTIVARITHGLVGNTEESFVSWLENNPLTVYYAIETATDTVITDTTLISQLEALVAGGAENGTTYIKVSATDPNLPGLLYVEAPKYE